MFSACKLNFNLLFLYMDSCITLGCCPEGKDSLLCSASVDPGVSCNLIGAQTTGVMEALLSIQGNGRVLLSLMTRRCPKLAPLWAAASLLQNRIDPSADINAVLGPVDYFFVYPRPSFNETLKVFDGYLNAFFILHDGTRPMQKSVSFIYKTVC
jgi:hypothetical protein